MILPLAIGIAIGLARGAVARGRLAVEVMRARAAASAMQRDLEAAILERDRARVVAQQLHFEHEWNVRARASAQRGGVN